MPPPKDRLAEMQEIAVDNEDDFTIPMAGEDIGGSLVEFLKQVEEIRATCELIDRNISYVKKLQSDILVTVSPCVDPNKQAEMYNIKEEVKRMAISVRSM